MSSWSNRWSPAEKDADSAAREVARASNLFYGTLLSYIHPEFYYDTSGNPSRVVDLYHSRDHIQSICVQRNKRSSGANKFEVTVKSLAPEKGNLSSVLVTVDEKQFHTGSTPDIITKLFG